MFFVGTVYFVESRGQQGCIKLVSGVSRIPDKLLMVRQITLKITTKKVGPKP